MATIAIAPAPVRAPKRSIDQDDVDPNPLVKRPRHLNFEKCSFCRKDKKRCQRAGKWPDTKCQRCIEKAFDCSEPISGKVVRASKIRDHDMDDDEDELLERIRHIQNQSCWLHDQQSLKRDANAIQRDYLEYSDAEASRRYHNFEALVDEAEGEIAISKRDLFQILKTSQSSHQLLYTQILLGHLPGSRALEISNLELDPMSEEKLDFITEQIDELHRLGATGLAKATQESLLMTIALMYNLTPLRLQREADKLNQLDSEFSSAIFEEVDGFGFSPVPLLLRPENLVHYRIIKAILSQYKQEPTMTDSIGRSPLHVALELSHTSTKVSASHDHVQLNVIEHNDCQIVKTLLSWGVPIGTRDIFGRTALHLACFYNWSLDVIQLLIEASDHDIDAKDVVGHTAFSWAVKKSNMELAKLLLGTEKVDVNTRDKMGCTPLYFAVKASNESMIRMLLAREDIAPSADEGGELSPLACALVKWDMDIIMLLTLWRGYGVNDNHFVLQHSDDWRSLLSLAAAHGHIHAVKFLLAVEGIDVNTKSRSGMTALDWARKKGHDEIVALLKDHELYQKTLTRENMVMVDEDDEGENLDDPVMGSDEEETEEEDILASTKNNEVTPLIQQETSRQ